MAEREAKAGRRQWSSRFGFLMAMVGSAVGLGNLWRFPYVAGRQGGAIFLIAYIVMVVLIGFTVMAAEIAVGRNAKSNIVSAFGKYRKRWSFVGILGVVICFLIVCYYNVIGGWIMRYMAGYLAGGSFVNSADSFSGAFQSFQSTPWMTCLFLTIFLSVSIAVILLGVKKGIEKVSKFMMPALFFMLLFIMVVSLCMKGAGKGVAFFIVPDWQRIQASGGLGSTVAAAMEQAFYSLSVGFGISATYGSYVDKSQHIPKNTMLICISDTLVAVIAGFAILPAVFASGLEPTQGPGLVFVTLPAVFHELGGFGVAVGFVFFLLVFFAAITSTISLFEVVVSAISEKLGLKRLTAGLLTGGAALAVGALIAVSQSGWLGQVDLLDWFDKITTSVLIPVSAFFICVYVGYVWKTRNALDELTNGGGVSFPAKRAWSFAIRYIVPVLVLVILVLSVIALF